MKTPNLTDAARDPDDPTPALQEALARAEALATSLIESSPDCLKRLDLQGNLLWIGEAGRHQLGLSDDSSHVGGCWYGWWEDVERAKVEAAVAQAASGQVTHFEAWATNRQGDVRCWSVTVSPIRNASGTPTELLASSRDVTQQRAQEALAAVHRAPADPPGQPFDVDGSPDGRHFSIFGLGDDGVVKSWNDSASALFGWKAEQIVGQRSDLIWTPEDRSAGVPQREFAIAARESFASDRRWHMRADGTRVFVDGVMIARLDATGRAAGFVKICRNETSRRLMEDELVGVRRRLDSALIAGEIGTYEWDVGADRLRGDQNFQRIFGISLDDRGGLPLATFVDLIHPDDRQTVLERVHHTVATGERYETEYRIRRPDGERWVIARGRIETEGVREPAARFSGVLLDITDRKRAEAQRQAMADERERQAREYDTILSTTDDFAYIFDLDGRFLYANRRLLEVWGVTLEQAIGKSLIELGYPVWHAAMHRNEIDEVIRTRKPIQGEVPFTGGSGISGVYEYVFTPVISPDGTVERVVGTTRDITERRAAEDAIRVAESRTRFIAELGDATRDLLDPGEVVMAVAQRLGEHLGVSRCAYADVEADGNTFTIHRDYCNLGIPSSAGTYSLDLFGTHAAAEMRAGRMLVLRDVDAELGVDDDIGRATFRAIDVRAIICSPLVRAGRLVAMIAVHQTTPRDWSAEDVALMEAVVERSWAYLERARGVRALAASESQFRQLADAMPQIVFASQPDGTVDYFNRRWYEYTGLAEQEDLGFDHWRHVHDPAYLDWVAARWLRSTQTGLPYEAEYPLRRHDGAWRWHLARALPVLDANNRIIRWFGTNTDIHDQKIAENALATEKAVLERIAAGARLEETLDEVARGVESQSADGMLCSILLVDADARLLRHAAAPSLPDEYCQAVDGLAIAPDSGSCGAAAFTRGLIVVDDIASDSKWTAFREPAISHGLAACTSLPILRADGTAAGTIAAYYRDAKPATERDIELLRTAGHIAGIAIERARAEATIRAALDAERSARADSEHAGRMKDEFLATLSHELRTPLSAILGWSQMLRREGTKPESLRQGLETIERNARAQTQIIEDLLDMSRIISGKVVLDTRRLELATVVKAAVETVRPTAMAKGVELDVNVPGTPSPVVGDANRLQQVFWNLLTNAVKFTPRGGVVRVELDRVDSQWGVHVADSGEGIRTDFLPFVFDRFRQADASTTRKHGGLGLGLAIVKQIVELHGGRVSATSDGEGHGATFSVVLPMSVLRASPDARQDELVDARENSQGNATDVSTGERPESLTMTGDQSARLAGARILVVDDEADAREMLRHLLESCGAVVSEAENADRGVAQAQSFAPEVIVSDIGMPGENGYSMLARIRASRQAGSGEVPAIALTAYARADDRIRAIRAGFQMHVPKPVEPAELIETVASLLRRPG